MSIRFIEEWWPCPTCSAEDWASLQRNGDEWSCSRCDPSLPGGRTHAKQDASLEYAAAAMEWKSEASRSDG